MKFRIIISAFLAVVIGVSAAAQSRSGYFLDNYIYNFQLNPALQPTSSFFFSIPALGNVNLGVGGTLGINDVLFPVNINGQKRTTTFMNPQISASEFLSGIKEKNRMGINTKIGIMAFGFKGFGGFNTISLNANAVAQIYIPKAFFQLAKEGLTNTTYDIHNLGAMANGYVDLSFSHSRNITKDLRVGAAIKILAGAGNAELKLDRAELRLGKDAWEVVTEGSLQANLTGASFEQDYNENTKRNYVSGIDYDSFKLGGFGAAIDLGAEYTFNQDWKFSVALLDLGFIKWKNNLVAKTSAPDGKTSNLISTDIFHFNVDDNASNSFSDELDKVADDLSYLYQLEDQGNSGGKAKMIGATLNIGAEYVLPIYRRVSFGALSSTRLQGKFTWTEMRVSANYMAAAGLGVTVTGATGTYGTGLGWLLNLKSFFIGMDYTMYKFSKQFIPLQSQAQINMGINLAF